MSNNNGWLGYININLSAKEKAEVKKTEITEAGLIDWLAERAANGYRFTMAHDQERDCFVATLTCRRDDDINYGYSMSQRHSHYVTALRALWYAHEVKSEGNWNTGVKQERLQFNW